MDGKTFGQPDESPHLDHPFETVLRALTRHGCRVATQTRDKARLTCPTHRDARPSLVLTRKTNKVLLFCFAGCRAAEVVEAIGLRLADLFAKGAPVESEREVAVYDYCDLSGELVAQKVRLAPKGFRWRRPDPTRPNRWLPGLAGAKPGLYRLPDLAGQQRVFCHEGEKSVDLCWSLGIPACCPPSGASSWKPEWSADLQQADCAEVVVLPDADRSGLAHAERVAQACWALPTPLPVKVIRLPGLSDGADAFDWLQAHSPNDLLTLAQGASYWSPGALERARAERKRALSRDRVRRFRARIKAEGLADATNGRAAAVTEIGNAETR